MPYNRLLAPLPPGNFSFPVIGETLSLLRDPQFAKKRHDKYGNIVRTNILGRPTILVRGGEAIAFILTNENRYFVNFLPSSAQTLLGSRSLSQQTGTLHQERRKLLYQAFQPRTLLNYISTIESITQHYFDKWQKFETFAWYPELRNYTFDIACKFLMGIDFASKSSMGRLFEVWSKGLFSIPLNLPRTNFSHALKSRQKILAEIEKIIEQRQQKLDKTEDALSILLQEHDASNLSLEEIKDQILLLLFAGHETLTSALSSLCLLLAQNPEILKRCYIEQQNLKNKELTFESLKQASYLEQVLQEVLRLIPPVGGGFRKVIRTCEFNGYQFPEGWFILYEILNTHQEESIYYQPEQFLPERLEYKQLESMKRTFNYVPFGGGMRECIGKEFARLEMKIFASLLIRNYTWKLPEQNLEMLLVPVPYPKDNLKVNFTKI